MFTSSTLATTPYTAQAAKAFATRPGAAISQPQFQGSKRAGAPAFHPQPGGDIFIKFGTATKVANRVSETTDKLNALFDGKASDKTAQAAAIVGKLSNEKTLSNRDRLALIQGVTGSHSPFSKMAEKALINDQKIGLKDLLSGIKPHQQGKNGGGIAAGIQAIGIGLLMLSIALPAGMIQPGLMSKTIATLGASLA